MEVIYLDNQSTTPIDPKVYKAMKPWLIQKFGNASSRNHQYGWEANEAIEISRESVAKLIGAYPREIVFTSGATEANNIALQGASKYYHKKGKHIITLQTEHRAVLDVCSFLEQNDYRVTRIPVEKDGLLNLNKLEEEIKPDTILVSIMHVNNEIGVIQSIKDIGSICKRNEIILHVDAAQSAGKVPIDVYSMGIDLLSFSGHKLYGPMGVGALFIRNENPAIKLQPILFGGGQEKGYRPGTSNVPNIVGFGISCDISNKNMLKENERIKLLRDLFLEKLSINELEVNGSKIKRVSGNLNITLKKINNESLIAATPELAYSTGSACNTTKLQPSHVLLALGLSKDDIYSSIRFGIGRFNTADEINMAADLINLSVKKIKKNYN